MHGKKLFGLENEGKGHGVQYSQWRQSTAHINLCRSHMVHFCDSSQRFRDISVSNLWLKNSGQCHFHIHYRHIRRQILSSIKVTLEHFSPTITTYQQFTFQNSRPWNCRSWRKAFAVVPFAVVPFDGTYQTFCPTAVVCSISHRLRDIRKWNKIRKVLSRKWRFR